MNTIHLNIIQPAGYVHSLGFLDQARYLRWQLRRLGAEVSIAKNTLREDALNIVFGAHLGFDAALLKRHACLFFNLEQLGRDGASLTPDYLQLLASGAAVDYDADNLPAYSAAGAPRPPVVPFWFAPYLRPELSPALEERPIDLLFFGSMNPRRQAFIERIEASGRQVAGFDRPLYGPERDAFIRQAKAVVNCHFYESNRFEQARASHCLSLGTPYISERGPAARPDAVFDEAVFWLGDDIEGFFRERFATPAFFDTAYDKLLGFQRHDPAAAYADLLGFAQGFHAAQLPQRLREAMERLEEGGLLEIALPADTLEDVEQRFWQLGHGIEHRFVPAGGNRLQKIATTPAEKTIARMMRDDFGGLPDDAPDAQANAADLAQATVAAALASARTVAIKAAERAPWLVLYTAHHDQVTDNFAFAIAAALRESGRPAEAVDVGQAGQLRRVQQSPAAVLTIGTLPLTVTMAGRPLHQALRCPVYCYFLDSPIYDFARVPVSRQFVEDAWQDERLIPVLAERSYLQALRAGEPPLLPPQSFYLPFAAFPTADPAGRKTPPPQRRLLVVGSLGQELAAQSVRADLMQTLVDANRPAVATNELARLAERLLSPTARGNCALDTLDALQLAPRSLLDPAVLQLVCAGDSFVKRARRLAGIEALRGLPVDFVGPGWEAVFGKEKSFRFLGSVAHGDLAPMASLYRGLLNFDPNWECGMHDRVYTALSRGVPVMTQANAAIAEEGLAGPLIHSFEPQQAGPLAAIGARLVGPAKAPRHQPVSLDRIGWAARLRAALAEGLPA